MAEPDARRRLLASPLLIGFGAGGTGTLADAQAVVTRHVTLLPGLATSTT